MKRNIGMIDRTVRVIVGLAILAALIYVEGPLRWLGLIGLVPLVTGLLGSCPLYTWFGFASCPAQGDQPAVR
jgi:hypothetical protein